MKYMKIRQLEDKDIKQCLDIYNYYIENTCFTLEEDKLDLDTFTLRCKNILKNFPFIVYLDDNDNVLGYAYLNYFNTRSAYKITADLSIYVDRNHLKEHIGINLLNQIEKLAKDRGISNIISIVTSENKNSFNFHLKNGFKLEGSINNIAIKFNKIISTYYFKKVISGINN